MKWLASAYKFLGSLKMAVIVILLIAVISAIGTIVESRFDMITSQTLVYHTWYMYGALGLLVMVLVISAVERLPWQRKHIGFVVAHVGIIILIFGSWVTARQGIDGVLNIGIGESQRMISIPRATDLLVYETLDGNFFNQVKRDHHGRLLESTEGKPEVQSADEVDFLKDPPTSSEPYVIKTKDSEIRITEYWPYAIKKSDITESERTQDGPALRFQLKNPNVTVTEWVVQEGTNSAKFDMGPAKVILAKDSKEPAPTGNAILVYPATEKGKFHYSIFTASTGGLSKTGLASVGEPLQTGWMGLEFKALQIFPNAARKTDFQKLDRPTPISTSAMKVEFQGKTHWLGLNSVLRLFTDNKGYIVTYQNRRMDLGFDVRLTDFKVGRYQGTMRASSYQSEVLIESIGKQLISMNEPLKHQGYTFYQASFQENEFGQPIASVLSVNRDPGRWIKYFGALLILLGSIILFYFKKRLASTASNSSSSDGPIRGGGFSE